MAIALDLKKGICHAESTSIEFNVIEVASAIGWDSGVVKYQLKSLEWTSGQSLMKKKNRFALKSFHFSEAKANGMPKRSPISVQFKNLGFRIQSRGDLTDDELDATLNDLYSRVVLQEKSQLAQLNNVFDGLSSVAYQTFIEAQTDELSGKRSDQLKGLIRAYFQCADKADANRIDAFCDDDADAPVDQIVRDVRTMIALYPENNFTGRNIARIFHGVASPVYPAQIWSRCKLWRGHVKTDFNLIVKLANSTIVKMRT